MESTFSMENLKHFAVGFNGKTAMQVGLEFFPGLARALTYH